MLNRWVWLCLPPLSSVRDVSGCTWLVETVRVILPGSLLLGSYKHKDEVYTAVQRFVHCTYLRIFLANLAVRSHPSACTYSTVPVSPCVWHANSARLISQFADVAPGLKPKPSSVWGVVNWNWCSKADSKCSHNSSIPGVLPFFFLFRKSSLLWEIDGGITAVTSRWHISFPFLNSWNQTILRMRRIIRLTDRCRVVKATLASIQRKELGLQ